ncbi:MAG: tetratricopeptide repeat protein [Aureispira sp.]|nr:tetratricopeptide repeat protein [Aureispira sp.]
MFLKLGLVFWELNDYNQGIQQFLRVNPLFWYFLRTKELEYEESKRKSQEWLKKWVYFLSTTLQEKEDRNINSLEKETLHEMASFWFQNTLHVFYKNTSKEYPDTIIISTIWSLALSLPIKDQELDFLLEQVISRRSSNKDISWCLFTRAMILSKKQGFENIIKGLKNINQAIEVLGQSSSLKDDDWSLFLSNYQVKGILLGQLYNITKELSYKEEFYFLLKKIEATLPPESCKENKAEIVFALNQECITINLDENNTIEAKKIVVTLLKKTKELAQKASLLHNLGYVYFVENQLTEAEFTFEQALSIYKELGDIHSSTRMKFAIAKLLKRNPYTISKAKSYFQELVNIFDNLGDEKRKEECIRFFNQLHK